MNILFLSGCNINPYDGGIARVTKILADSFSKEGNNVFYLGYRKKSEDDIFRQFYFPSNKPEVTPQNQQYLEELIVKKKINVVIVQLNPCKEYIVMLNECKKKCNILVVSCFHNLILTQVYNYAYGVEYKLKKNHLSLLFLLLRNKWINWMLVQYYIYKNREVYKYIVDNSDLTVVLSYGHKKELLRMIGQKSNTSIHIIPNCVSECNAFQTEKSNDVLWVGNVDCSVKRIDFMIDVWKNVCARHPNWLLHILGDGPSLQEMKNKVRMNNIPNVIFEGRVIPGKYYDKAKILCVTSVQESFSLVTVEAKMYGAVPIVQNSFPIAGEIVNDGKDGILAKPFCLDNFCEKLDILMSSNEMLNDLSKAAVYDSHRYSPKNILKLWEELLATHTKHEL